MSRVHDNLSQQAGREKAGAGVMGRTKREKSILVVLLALLLFIAASGVFFAFQSGLFGKDPEVDVKANNAYDETLIVVMGEYYPPFSFVKDGEYTGHDVELANMLANRLGMNLKTEYLSWSECIDAVQSGKADMIMSVDYEYPEEGIEYTIPVADNPWMAFSKGDVRSYAGLYGKRIGIGENTDALSDSSFADSYVEFDSYETAFDALERGEVDVVITKYPVGTYIADKKGYVDISATCELAGGHFAVGVREDRAELLEQLNDVILDMSEDGTLGKLSDKWFGTFVRTYSLADILGMHPEYFLFVGAVVLLLLAMIALLAISESTSRKRLAQRDAEEAMRLIDSVASIYNIAYQVNMAEDTYKLLRMESPLISKSQISGFATFSEIIRGLSDFLHPDERKHLQEEFEYATIRKKLEDAQSYNIEYRVFIDGVIYWHELNITKIDDDNIAVGFAEKDLEITKLHLEDRRFAQYFALYGVDIDTDMAKIVIDSPYYDASGGRKAVPYRAAMISFADSLEGEAREFFLQLSDLDFVKEQFATEDRKTFSYRSSNVHNAQWVDLTSYVTLRHEDGSPAMFSLGFSDIDSLGAARQELQSRIAAQKVALEESLTFTNYFLEEYESAYYVGLDDLSWSVYRRTADLAGNYPPGESYVDSLGRFIETEVHPDDRNLVSVLVEPERLKEELAKQSPIRLFFRRMCGESERNYQCTVIRGADDDHAAFGFMDITDDVREQQAQTERLQEALEMAQAADRAKTEFLFNMSHDIRTPMNAITGFTTMARKYIDDKEAVTDYLEKIDASGKQMLSLVNGVLEMSRIESGKIGLEERPINIQQEFNAVSLVLSEQAQMNGQEFNCSLEGMRHFNVLADESKVSSIVLNVAGNALKYTPEGGRIDLVLKEIASRKPGCASYLFTVADTGIGMSKEFQKTLFDPFAREKTSTVSGIQGTGLGTAIVKRFVDLMGGDIEVDSAPGKGTRFDITLDFKIDEEASVEAKPIDAIRPVSFKGRTALLVEDNELNREIALDILEEEGLEVEEAEDGSIAVELLRQKGPEFYDFILMDIQMPVMDGYEATRAIREMYPDAALPIIAVSANAFAEDKARSLDAGMDDHVAKPVDVGELLTALARFL